VTVVGREGGDASDADVIVVAVPSDVIADALSRVTGIKGKPALDAMNPWEGRKQGFPSLSAEVKSITQGPVAKALNTTWAEIFEEIPSQRVRPSCVYCGDVEAQLLAEQLVDDAGFAAVYAGGLDQARAIEEMNNNVLAAAMKKADRGPFFYRIARPGEL